MNPLSDAVLHEAVERLDLVPGATVLDLGCGKGNFLQLVVDRWQAVGIGVDLNPLSLEEARHKARAGRLEFQQGDARNFSAPNPFDAVVCLGPGWDHGTLEDLVGTLVELVSPRGKLLVADLYWRSPPSASYLSDLGVEVGSMRTHQEHTCAGDSHALRLTWSNAATSDDFARYERTFHETALAWSDAHPDDPDAADVRALAEDIWSRHRAGGRTYLGFAVYLFERV